jgi:hypothetical protein
LWEAALLALIKTAPCAHFGNPMIAIVIVRQMINRLKWLGLFILVMVWLAALRLFAKDIDPNFP